MGGRGGVGGGRGVNTGVFLLSPINSSLVPGRSENSRTVKSVKLQTIKLDIHCLFKIEIDEIRPI